MIKIFVFQKNRQICGWQIKGHSGYAQAGADIVCAAVSTAAEMALESLKQAGVVCKTEIHDGFMQVQILESDPKGNQICGSEICECEKGEPGEPNEKNTRVTQGKPSRKNSKIGANAGGTSGQIAHQQCMLRAMIKIFENLEKEFGKFVKMEVKEDVF